jgi:hypothetical protein
MVPGMNNMANLPNFASDNRPNIIRIEQNFYDQNQNADANNNSGGFNKKNNRRKDGGKVPEKSLVTPLYKTRLCNFHMMGACHRGAGCSYAHGEQDLRPSPDFERTSVCPTMLKKGFCDRQHCRYAHNAEELRTQAGLLKTKMCNFYMKGLCVVGQACRFAHSKEELQEAMLVQKVAAPPPPTQPRCTDPELWERRRRAFGVHPTARAGVPGSSGNPHPDDTVVYSPHDARGSEDETNDDVGNVEPAQVVRGKVVVDLDDDSAPSPLEPAPLPNFLGAKGLDLEVVRPRSQSDIVVRPVPASVKTGEPKDEEPNMHKVWVDTDCEDVIEELVSNPAFPDSQPVYYGDTDDEDGDIFVPASRATQPVPASRATQQAVPAQKGVPRVITKNTFLTIAGYQVGAESLDAA